MRITRVEFEIDGEEYLLSVSKTNLFRVRHKNGYSLIWDTIIMGVITDEIRYEKMLPISDMVMEQVSMLLVLLIGSYKELQYNSILAALHTMS